MGAEKIVPLEIPKPNLTQVSSKPAEKEPGPVRKFFAFVYWILEIFGSF